MNLSPGPVPVQSTDQRPGGTRWRTSEPPVGMQRRHQTLPPRIPGAIRTNAILIYLPTIAPSKLPNSTIGFNVGSTCSREFCRRNICRPEVRIILTTALNRLLADEF